MMRLDSTGIEYIAGRARRPVGLFLALAMAGIGTEAAAQQSADIDRLKALIEAQQQQLDALREELEAMRADQVPQTSGERLDPYETETMMAPAAQEREPMTPTRGVVLLRREDGALVTLSGQINQAMNIADDGKSTDLYFVDNDVSGSRFRLAANAPLGQATMGAVLEVGVSGNNSYEVSQDNQRADDVFTVRHADMRIRDDGWGQFWFGRGSAASDGKAEYDLSLVASSIMYSGVADPVGGLQFTDGSNLTGIAVGDAFFNFDGVRMNRVRYDSPMMGPLQASVSAGSDERWDLGLTLGGNYGEWSGISVGDFVMLGAVAVADPSSNNVDYRLMGSGSVLHEPTGLSFTVSAGKDDLKSGSDPYNLYFKLGYDTRLFSVGATGFGLDYTRNKHVSGQGDEGESVGLAVLQTIDSYGIDLYGQFRRYSLDRAVGPSFEDISVFTAGARWAF